VLLMTLSRETLKLALFVSPFGLQAWASQRLGQILAVCLEEISQRFGLLFFFRRRWTVTKYDSVFSIGCRIGGDNTTLGVDLLDLSYFCGDFLVAVHNNNISLITAKLGSCRN
jgi:hypothetical protein